MRAASLFSGIGGLERGFASIIDRLDYMVEIDPVARAVLAAQFPDVKIHEDVRLLSKLGKRIELLLAGFPCQDVSSVGPKAGLEGTKTSLVSNLIDLLGRDRVPYVVLENVPFILHLGKGALLDYVITSLESLGYDWAYRLINSHSFLPQRRRRVLLVATQSGEARRILLRNPGFKVTSVVEMVRPIGFYWTEGAYATGLSDNSVPALKPGSTIGIPSPPAIHRPDGFVGTPDIRDAERLQGFPDGWTRPAEGHGRASARWRLVGNAVPIPVARWVAEGFSAECSAEPLAPRRMCRSERFTEAAFGDSGGRFSVDAESYVSTCDLPLLEFLKYDLKPLSVKAVDGFLTRADRGSMRFPEGFLSSLRAHSAAMNSARYLKKVRAV